MLTCPECKADFEKKYTQQKYCSKKCHNRVNSRRWRERVKAWRDAAEAAENEKKLSEK